MKVSGQMSCMVSFNDSLCSVNFLVMTDIQYTPLSFSESVFESEYSFRVSVESISPMRDVQCFGACNSRVCCTGYTQSFLPEMVSHCVRFEWKITDTQQTKEEGILTCTLRSSITYITETGALLLLVAAVHTLHTTAHWNTASGRITATLSVYRYEDVIGVKVRYRERGGTERIHTHLDRTGPWIHGYTDTDTRRHSAVRTVHNSYDTGFEGSLKQPTQPGKDNIHILIR